jgi:dipeptidyl aminopeptidase/acylaminoacyl peptidase
MHRLIVSLFVLLLSLPSFSQAKHPFTFEDMMALKRVEEPMPSPDGKWVLFGAVDVDLEKNSKTPHVWIVPLAGGQEREIIKDQDADRPRWAPDGKRFAFISNKEGGSQIWIADFDSASGTVTGVHQLTSIATEASGEIWSPDGKNIAFTSDVYPECDGAPAAEQECNAKKLKEAEQSKVKALIFDRLLYRHWNAYKEGKRTHILVVPVDACVGAAPLASTEHVGTAASAVRPGGAGQNSTDAGEKSRASLDRTAEGGCPHLAIARDLTPGDFDSPVFSLGGQDNYAFSPDGQELCYTSNHDKVEATSTNNDLWIVPVSGGPAKNITGDNPASDSTPLYSPDGKYIAYRAQQRPGYESDRFRLMLYDRKTGKKSSLSDGQDAFDRWVDSFTWSPDSKRIFLTAADNGESPVYMVPAQQENPLVLFETGGSNDSVTVTPDGKALVFSRTSIGFPAELFVRSLAPDERYCGWDCLTQFRGHGEEAKQLTHMNDGSLSQIAMSSLEPFWFDGSTREPVQGFLVKPPNFDPSKKYPVKFLIHGGPQGAWGDDWSYRWNAELFAANGYVVIMINFHGSTGYGQKFIDAINGDWGGAPFEDLMKGLDYAEQHYPFIDKDRECALGASYGGYMIDWILGHTNRFKCLVSHDGMFNTDSAWGTTEELWFNEWEFKGTPYTNRELYRKWSPHLSATNFKTPTLVIHSQRDYRLDVSEGFQLFTTLQRLGVPSKMLYFPDEGHWVLKPQNSRLWYKTVNDWVDQWIGK